MRIHQFLSRAFLAGCVWLVAATGAGAAEYGFTSYVLGSNAFGAGVTPPPGTYVTEATGFYSGNIGTSVSFGGVTLNPGAKVEFFNAQTNILYVPERKVFGGNLGLSVTIPVGHIDVDATLGGPLGLSRSVDGWGFGDVVPKVQLRMAARRLRPYHLPAGGYPNGPLGPWVLADHRSASSGD